MALFSLLGLLFSYLSSGVPLEKTSLVTLRTTNPPASGGNIGPLLYRDLVLEEWSSSYTLLQNWSVPCTLPSMATETLTEGILRSRYPFGDGVWFLCREVPSGANISYTPAPVAIMYLQEDGTLNKWSSDTTTFPASTSTNLVVPWFDALQGLNVFYLLGGGKPGAAGTAARPPQPRILIDTGPGTPPDTQGILANLPANANPIGMTIMTDSLFIPAQVPNGTTTSMNVYLVGTDNVLPTAGRMPTSVALANQPLWLSSWTFPYADVMWFTGFNRVPYLARTNFSGTGQTFTFTQPASSSPSGTLGGSAWRVNSARFEGNYFATGDTIYISNGTDIYKSTLIGLAQQPPMYQSVLRAPPGWRFLDAHARVVFLPSPSATASASATATASASASASATGSASASSTAIASVSATESASASSTTSASASSSSSASATQTAMPTETATASATTTRDPLASPSITPTPTSKMNGTVPDNQQRATSSLSPGESTGVSIGVLGIVLLGGILAVKYVPPIKTMYVRQFGSSFKGQTRQGSYRKPITSEPITITQNNQLMILQRIEHLKQIQKMKSIQELTAEPSIQKNDVMKKEFQPVVVQN